MDIKSYFKFVKTQAIDVEVLNHLTKLYYLRQFDFIDLEDLIKGIWASCGMCSFKYVEDTHNHYYNLLIKSIDYYVSWAFDSTVEEDERKCKNLAADFLFYIFTNIEYDEGGTAYILPIWEPNSVIERIKDCKKMSQFDKLYNYKDDAWEMFRDIVKEQMGVDISRRRDRYDNKEELDKLVETSIPIKVDKRYKIRDILMIDSSTSETVKVFRTREDVISTLGINKGTLSDCLRTSKDPNKPKWRKWKNKDDGKKYFFVEKFK